jgi:carboxylate-amine ligase
LDCKLIENLLEVISKRIFANARGAIARFDRQTIEIRIIDVQECPLSDLAILMAVSRLIERLASDPRALSLGNSLSSERLWAVLHETMRAGEHEVIKDAAYLECLGFRAHALRSGDVLGGLIESLPGIAEPYRGALDIILQQGTLASRMKRITGPCTREHLMETCRVLCDCLQENRLLIP